IFAFSDELVELLFTNLVNLVPPIFRVTFPVSVLLVSSSTSFVQEETKTIATINIIVNLCIVVFIYYFNKWNLFNGLPIVVINLFGYCFRIFKSSLWYSGCRGYSVL